MSDEKVIITPVQAESLLIDDPYVHNFAQAGNILVGCDYSREDALAAFNAAKLIELGGDGCKRMGHAIVVHDGRGSISFFAADKDRVAAYEDALMGAAS